MRMSHQTRGPAAQSPLPPPLGEVVKIFDFDR